MAKRKKKLAKDENKHKNKCSSCTLYIVLFSIFFTVKVGIGTYFFIFTGTSKNITRVKFGIYTQTTIS